MAGLFCKLEFMWGSAGLFIALGVVETSQPKFYVDHVHLVTDGTVNQLHDFAQSIGVKRCWFHNTRGKNKPHYDLKPYQVQAAIEAGAIKVSSKKIINVLRKR